MLNQYDPIILCPFHRLTGVPPNLCETNNSTEAEFDIFTSLGSNNFVFLDFYHMWLSIFCFSVFFFLLRNYVVKNQKAVTTHFRVFIYLFFWPFFFWVYVLKKTSLLHYLLLSVHCIKGLD